MATGTFTPWIGSKYEVDGFNGPRILITAESHHGKNGLSVRAQRLSP